MQIALLEGPWGERDQGLLEVERDLGHFILLRSNKYETL